MGEGGRGAVTNVGPAGVAGIRRTAVVSVNSDTANDVLALFCVAGAGVAAGAAAVPACRRFSQHGQA